MIYLERLRKIEERAAAIEKELIDTEVLKDHNKYQKLMKELAQLRPILSVYHEFRQVESALADLKQSMTDKNLDPDMKALYEEEEHVLTGKREKILSELETRLLRETDSHADRDIIIEIRAGTGGEEAALFSADLFRMYSQYAAQHGFQLDIMNSNPTGKGGFKELIFSVSGRSAYGLFKFESGIHRVQRVPTTESSGRIHTSAVTVAVLVEADESEIVIEPKDLKIDVFRASGAGGQHVNKTESAVRITHLPSSLVVTCQDERSQHKNKTKAMRVLRARLYEMKQMAHQQEMATQRKKQVGTGDRSGKIRTYNFMDRRVTDHRIGLTLHDLDDILDGHLDELVHALAQHEKMQKLTNAA